MCKSSLSSAVDETAEAHDHMARVNESSFDPAVVQQAIAISEGRDQSTPTVHHLQALVEFFGGTASHPILKSF